MLIFDVSRKFFAPLLSALLLAAPFLWPRFFPLAWFAFVPLFWAVYTAASWRSAVFSSWVAGFLAHLFGFYWLVYTISVFGGFSYPISGFIFLLYSALQGIQFALFAFFIRYSGLGPLNVYAAVFWVALEFWFPLLFPWHLANSQSAFTTFIQSADLVGPFGASLIIMWANAVIYELIVARRRKRRVQWLPAALVGLLFMASLGYGFMRLKTVTALITSAPKLTMAAVQGNIEVGMKWNPKLQRANLDAQVALTRNIAGAQVVLWPESAIEEWLPDNLTLLPAPFVESLNLKGAYFIFGARSFRGNPGTSDLKAFNTAFLADDRGDVLNRYHKQVLLAFGEYIPFSNILSKLPGLPFSDGFTPGVGPQTLNLAGGVRIAPLICYEDLMPELSRQFVKQMKANVLVNLTNDAWYGKSVAPWQHAWLAQWRAIETRRSLLRVTNTGVTALINAKGEIQETLPIFVPAVLKTKVEILEGETAYVRYGDWFAWSATMISLAILVFCVTRRRS
jgi:apolipoprotein N-acyltransferase